LKERSDSHATSRSRLQDTDFLFEQAPDPTLLDLEILLGLISFSHFQSKIQSYLLAAGLVR